MSIESMREKLCQKQQRAELRYKFYEMKYYVPDFGISTPPKLKNIQTTLGWCGKAVDALADRIQVRKFENDVLDFENIFSMNNPDVIFDSAVLSALITACSFIYVAPQNDDMPKLQVIDGRNATGIIDPITGFLIEGYAVLDSDDNGIPILEAYFTAEETIYYRDGEEAEHIPNPARYPLLVPVIHRPDAKRPFGHSVIKRSCMDLVKSACRTLKRSEISAEFYSFPQKYIVGLSTESEGIDKWAAAMSTMLSFTKDEDGDKPSVGQFQQQSMSPYIDHLRAFASAFASETGLTIDDLGFVSDNPSSAEAIKASHENLRLAARKAQRNFASGFKNAGFIAASVRDGFAYKRDILADVRVIYEPIFEPDAAMLSSIGDGIIKLNAAVPNFIDSEAVRNLTGIDGAGAKRDSNFTLEI